MSDLTKWLRTDAGTGVSSVDDVVGENTATQTVEARKPVASGAPRLAFATDGYLTWDLTAAGRKMAKG